MEIWPGEPFPLGATFDGSGTNFSLFSEVAARVELCLFDAAGEETHVDLPEITAYCWHGYLPGIRPGQRYGYRVHGPGSRTKGTGAIRPSCCSIPTRKAIEGGWEWNEAVFPYHFDDPDSSRNDARQRAVHAEVGRRRPTFDWGDDRRRGHAAGTRRHLRAARQGIHHAPPEPARACAARMRRSRASRRDRLPAALGVTAVELLPVHQFVHDSLSLERGLRNYWGYNSIGYFAPHNEYRAAAPRGEQVEEFKQMVRALHAAGIEVILDVVYNHTAEGNHLGPMLSFKGIDNAAYYRLVGDNRRYYMDYTGTATRLNMRHPHVLQLIMDTLRYWVLEMHVDGFRFDLASTLARELHDVDRLRRSSISSSRIRSSAR